MPIRFRDGNRPPPVSSRRRRFPPDGALLGGVAPSAAGPAAGPPDGPEGLLLVPGSHGSDVVVVEEVAGSHTVRGVAVAADAGPEGLVGGARAPGPAGALGDGEVVVAEGEDGGEDADEEAEEDVEAVVPEVEPARARDEDGGEGGERADGQQVDRRGRRLPPHCRHGRRVHGQALV